MTDDLWQRAQEAFDRVRNAPFERRAEELDAVCAGDAALRAEVESLLRHDTNPDAALLDSPGNRLRSRNPALDHWVQRLRGKTIGHYRLQKLIASGGMGCVFEARQEHPDRAVAVKLMRPGLSATSALARFRVEPEILGRLQHANIAQVYEAGVYDDVLGPLPYFAMELIPDAQTLADYVQSRRLSLIERLALFIKVCDAVHHGHQKGIIHRDLKPANILVGHDGEPKIIDFGVARATDSDVVMTTMQTKAGDIVGTLRYMSPEQCDGIAAKIDTRSDIYSLGVVLYELVTGVPPYETAGTTLSAAIQIIKNKPPQRPSLNNRALRGDLDVILLKTLEKEPAQRYASAAALADDLRRVLAHEPITARPPNLAYTIRRYLRRHVWQSVAAGFAVAGLAALLVFLAIERQYQAEREKETLERKQAAYRGSLQSAEGALSANDGQGAAYQLELIDDKAQHYWEWYHLKSRADQSVEVHRIRADRSRAQTASTDRAGRFLVQEAQPGPRVDIYDRDTYSVQTIEPDVLNSPLKNPLPAA